VDHLWPIQQKAEASSDDAELQGMYVQEDHVLQLAAAPELKAAGSSLQCWELCSLCSYHY
jgi:hypothetical protein